jgi:hypothetical protein
LLLYVLPFLSSMPCYNVYISQVKERAESLDVDLDLLMAAFSEISRLSTEVAVEDHSTPRLS